MRNLPEAEKLLQAAYDFDIGRRTEMVNLAAIDTVGVQTLHIAYYDSCMSQLAEIQQHLQDFPSGVLATLIIQLRDIRVQAGEYSTDTLNAMYGLLAH